MSWQELELYRYTLGGENPAGSASASGDIGQLVKYIAANIGGVTEGKFLIVPKLDTIVSKGTVAAVAAATIAAANRAVYIPFTLSQGKTLAKIHVFNGATAAGNLDVGVYSHDGATKHVSMGSTAQSGTATVQSFDVGDTELPAGNYYAAVVGDNATATLLSADFDDPDFGAFMGCKQQATAFPLPSSATFATWVNDKLPLIVLEFTS